MIVNQEGYIHTYLILIYIYDIYVAEIHSYHVVYFYNYLSKCINSSKLELTMVEVHQEIPDSNDLKVMPKKFVMQPEPDFHDSHIVKRT